MKTGGLITATCVLAVLGGLVFWAQRHPPAPATPTPVSPKIIADDAKQIDNISIVKTGSDPVVLTKIADKWEITKPSPMPADQDTAGALVNAVAALNADRLIDDKATDLNPFGLATPARRSISRSRAVRIRSCSSEATRLPPMRLMSSSLERPRSIPFRPLRRRA